MYGKMKEITPFVLVLFLMHSTSVSAYEPATTVEKQIGKIGDIVQVLIPVSGYMATLMLDDREGQNQFYKSFFTNLAITYTLKYTIPKRRPEDNGEHSFPSGHTSAAFQGATFIHKRYGLKYSVLAYIGAVYVGFSREETDQHDMSDIIAGASIGILSSYYFTTSYKGITVTPLADNGFYGLRISKKW